MNTITPLKFMRHAALLLPIVALLGCASQASAQQRERGRLFNRQPPQEAQSSDIKTAPNDSSGPVAKNKIGSGGRGVWVFSPNSPQPASAPVVVFLHGYRATNPYGYGGWIDHMVKQGNSVIFPIFESSPNDSEGEIMSNIVQGVRDGLAYLERNGPKPDTSRVVFVGHSFGGGLSAQLAAKAKAENLPVPKAVLMAQPGWRGSDEYPAGPLADIPSSVYMLVIDGSSDQFASTRKSKIILCAARNVPNNRKAHVMLESGSGTIADHYAPLSPNSEYQLEEKTGRAARRESFVKKAMDIRDGETDDLDRNGFWRLFDAVQAAAFAGDGDIEKAIDGAGGEHLGPVRAKLLKDGC